MRALVVGAVDSSRVALETVAAAPGWSLAGVVTLPPEHAGRHSDFVDLEPRASALGARFIATADCNAPEVVDAVRALAPDVALVIGWSQICRRSFLDAVGGRAIGFHPAPLPRLRGRGVIAWTILDREPITAGTLFRIDEGVDTGPILAQRFFHVAPDETATSLIARHLEELRPMLAGLLDTLAGGDPPSIPQDDRLATFAARRTPADGRIDWSQPRDMIWRLVRASTRPYPGAFSALDGRRLVIFAARPGEPTGRHLASPGQIVAYGDAEFEVACGDGATLVVTDWESERSPRLHRRLGDACVAGAG